MTHHAKFGRWPMSIIMPNFMHICHAVTEIWLFFIFQDGGRLPSWIFKKFEILTTVPFGESMDHFIFR